MNKKWLAYIIIGAAAIFILFQQCSGDKAKCAEVVTSEQVFEEAIQMGNPHRDFSMVYNAEEMTPEQVFEQAIQMSNPHK